MIISSNQNTLKAAHVVSESEFNAPKLYTPSKQSGVGRQTGFGVFSAKRAFLVITRWSG